jgi:hypothetical protein
MLPSAANRAATFVEAPHNGPRAVLADADCVLSGRGAAENLHFYAELTGTRSRMPAILALLWHRLHGQRDNGELL